MVEGVQQGPVLAGDRARCVRGSYEYCGAHAFIAFMHAFTCTM